MVSEIGEQVDMLSYNGAGILLHNYVWCMAQNDLNEALRISTTLVEHGYTITKSVTNIYTLSHPDTTVCWVEGLPNV